jgi:hypothetical protein
MENCEALSSFGEGPGNWRTHGNAFPQQINAGWAIELRKDTTRTPTRLICAEGNMNGALARVLIQSGVVEDPRHA